MHRYRAVVIELCKLERVEIEAAALALANGQLAVVAKVVVHAFYLVDGREGLNRALLKFPLVRLVVEHYGKSLFLVASGASGLLKVGFERVGQVNVDDKPHIGLVDAHSEGVGGHNHACGAAFPGVLLGVALLGCEPGVVVVGADVVLHQKISNLLGFSPAAHIHNARSRNVVDDAQHIPQLVVNLAHKVDEVFALETLAENVALAEFELVLNIVDHLRRGGGGDCQHRNIGNQAADFGNLKVRRPEIVAPLRYAVRLVDGQ